MPNNLAEHFCLSVSLPFIFLTRLFFVSLTRYLAHPPRNGYKRSHLSLISALLFCRNACSGMPRLWLDVNASVPQEHSHLSLSSQVFDSPSNPVRCGGSEAEPSGMYQRGHPHETLMHSLVFPCMTWYIYIK